MQRPSWRGYSRPLLPLVLLVLLLLLLPAVIHTAEDGDAEMLSLSSSASSAMAEDEGEAETTASSPLSPAPPAICRESTGTDSLSSGSPSTSTSSCGCGALRRDGLHGFAAEKYAEEVQQEHPGAGETPAEAELIYLDGGEFYMGSDEGFFPEDGEGPARKVKVSPFLIGKYEVSNARFKRFIEATNYVTEAEKFGFSFVVEQFISKEVSSTITSAVANAPWWLPVSGSYWKHPEGVDSDLTGRMDHPVIHVSWNDALAFCKWSHPKGRLPTEAEWEFAASGGLKNRTFPWGNKMKPKGRHMMNTWQSTLSIPMDSNAFKHSFLPVHDAYSFYAAPNSAEDGYALTAPVNAYFPNKFGLYNTVGNVWEWTNDWFTNHHTSKSSTDPQGPATGEGKVKKGGSFMCHQFTCYRYRIAARMQITPDSSAANVGFRCAADP
eukprot:m.71924 g.71924  ORF g.71924 m.71924 type:complete len:437 (-) comp13840_c0_seq3:56-1366(-)